MKKYIRFIPIALAVGLIMSLTLMNTPKNVEMSEQFRQFLMKLCEKAGLGTNAWWNSSTGIRKLGHVIEYGLLGVGSAIAISRKRWSIVLCMVVSVFDQVIKIFVPIRHFDWTDIPFDIVGSLIGIGIVSLIERFFKRA